MVAEVLETAQFPTGGRASLDIVLDEIVRVVLLVSVNLGAPQDVGLCWLQADTFISCKSKG